ncbi:MAG: O-antigen ligase family protein [Erysipelotrichaceae bacterium]|nr:O-antigen ligase family protein [Erysipelotrichaceae bacterium]
MSLRIKLSDFSAIILMIFSFMGAYGIFTGAAGTLRWNLFYYGRFVFMSAFIFYFYTVKNYKIINKIKKDMIYLLLIPTILIFIYSIFVWFLQRPTLNFITRGVSDTLFNIVAIWAGITMTAVLKEKTIKYGMIAATVVFVTAFLLGLINEGYTLITSVFGLESEEIAWKIINKYVELHELLFILGIYIVYVVLLRDNKEKNKYYLWFLLVVGIFIIGGKRIGLAGVVFALFVGFFIRALKYNHIKRSTIILFGFISLAVCLIYAYLSMNLKIIDVFNTLHIDVLGRDIIYRYFAKFGNFGLTFLGRGVGFVTRQFDYATVDDLHNMISIKALHNDYMKLYLEIGIFGFVVWIYYWIVGLPKYFMKKTNIKSTIICFAILVYVFITYTTDNTISYFNFQLHLAMVLTYIYYKHHIDNNCDFKKKRGGAL